MKVEITQRELAQLLAAPRNWQTDSLNEDLAESFAGHFEDFEPMTDDEIDALCEHLNFAGDAPAVKVLLALLSKTPRQHRWKNEDERRT
jgi:hypothetical protein